MEQPKISPELAVMLTLRHDQRAKSEQVFALVSELMRIVAKSVPVSHRVMEDRWEDTCFRFEIHPASVKERSYIVGETRCRILPAGELHAAGDFWYVEKPEKNMLRDRYDRKPVEKLFNTSAAPVEQTALSVIDFLCHAAYESSSLERWVTGVFDRLPQTTRPSFRPD